MAMGTSVGTITLLAPIAVAVSASSGFDLPLCIASVMGGAMFGDNLSFISDTTIAACSTQGTEMKDKFRANFKIALPAALAALVLIIAVSLGTDVQSAVSGDHDLVLIIPYLLVLIGGILGLNVFVVLLIGIAAGAAITLITGQVTALELMGNMGGGVSGMFETILVTLLVASLCGLIRAYGGFESILAFIRRVFRGKRGGQLGIGLLVGLMDIATANNTVAIVMAGPIAKEVAEEYGISSKRSASLLDTFSCIFQGILPYGAQMLVALSTCATLGYAVSAFDIIPLLFYPFLLCLSSRRRSARSEPKTQPPLRTAFSKGVFVSAGTMLQQRLILEAVILPPLQAPDLCLLLRGKPGDRLPGSIQIYVVVDDRQTPAHCVEHIEIGVHPTHTGQLVHCRAQIA